MYSHQTSLCIFYLFTLLYGRPNLKFITILLIVFPIYAVDFKGGNASLWMY